VREIVKSALDGFKVCIFAFGQTCAGKTFTMEGGVREEDIGLVPRSVNMIFQHLRKYKKDEWTDTKVTLSCIEIHIENVRDLLDPSNQQAQIMTNFGKFKPTEVTVDEAEGVAYLLQKAKENRSVAATSMNQNSSRSHSIYSLKI